MRHEDFTSIDLDEILAKVLNDTGRMTGAQRVHWLSVFGLEQLRSNQNAFVESETIPFHFKSLPHASSIEQMLPLWCKVADLFANRPSSSLPTPHALLEHGLAFAYPVLFQGKLLGVVLLENPAETNPVRLLTLLRPSLNTAAKYIHFAYQYLAARQESFLDEVTGLYNQRYLPVALAHEIGRSSRYHFPFTLLFIDIDFFKQVNDGRGHWTGTKLLAEMGKVLKTQVRPYDYCFRYGGDEFIILLAQASPDEGKVVAERVRKAIESRTFRVEGQELKLTVSIGLAAYPLHAQTAVDLIQIADQAMYVGKRKSRNIVFVAS